MAQTSREQQHPQASKDRKTVEELLREEANDYNLTELARLLIRYRGFPGARDIQSDLERSLQRWGMTKEELFERTREIHSRGRVEPKEKSDREDWF